MVMPANLSTLPGGLSILSNSRLNVRYWHKADVPITFRDVRFWGKADIGSRHFNVR